MSAAFDINLKHLTFIIEVVFADLRRTLGLIWPSLSAAHHLLLLRYPLALSELFLPLLAGRFQVELHDAALSDLAHLLAESGLRLLIFLDCAV